MLNPVKLELVKGDKVFDVDVFGPADADYQRHKDYRIDIYYSGKPYSNIIGSISSTMLAIDANNLMGEKAKLTQNEVIVLLLRAHNKKSFLDKSNDGSFMIVSDNYKELIDRSDNLLQIRDEVLRILYVHYTQRYDYFIKGLSIYSSLPYEASKIFNSLLLLKKIGDIECKPEINASLWDIEVRLKPECYKTLDKKYSSTLQQIQPSKAGLPMNSEFKYDFFICHASEDKMLFVDDLAKALNLEGFKIWFDESSLEWGDDIPSGIDKGLINSRYGIVVLSHNFFAKRWPRKELSALFSLESSAKRILPIWLNITKDEINLQSPLIAERKAIKAEEGLPNIINAARRLYKTGQDNFETPGLNALEEEMLVRAERNDGLIDRLPTDQTIEDIIKIGNWGTPTDYNNSIIIQFIETIEKLETLGLIKRMNKYRYRLTGPGYQKAKVLVDKGYKLPGNTAK
jgi:hypothetical protein